MSIDFKNFRFQRFRFYDSSPFPQGCASMKMHRILAEAAATIAKSVFREHRVLDHELAAAFEANPKWGKRDRGFIAETVFEVARWRRALSFLVDSEETTALCTAQWVRMGYELPDWWNYNGRPAEEIIARESGVGRPTAGGPRVDPGLDRCARGRGTGRSVGCGNYRAQPTRAGLPAGQHAADDAAGSDRRGWRRPISRRARCRGCRTRWSCRWGRFCRSRCGSTDGSKSRTRGRR